MDSKQTFIQRCVNEYMVRTIADMGLAARRRKVGVSGEGIASLTYKSALAGSGVTATLSFAEWLRFVDMGVGRGHPLGGLKSVQVELQASNRVGNVFKKDNVRKPKKIYSKTAYGNLTYMYNKMLYGYSEEVIADIKAELEAQNKTQPTS